VYKAKFGSKYLIWKGKYLHQSLNGLAKQIDQRMRLGLDDSNLLKNVVEHIIKYRIPRFEVEVVTQSSDPVELLKSEYHLLKAASEDPKCLNTSFFPYFPKWITQPEIDKFRAYIKKTMQAKKKKNKPAKKKVAKKTAIKKKAAKKKK
jgi:hypothetical protein